MDRSRPCQGCAIALQLEITLRDSPVTPFGVNVTAIARDEAGRIYVPSRAVPGEVYVFGANGQYVRTIGRRGEGPGEYRVVNEALVGTGDSIRLFDNALARMTVLSPSLVVTRTARMPVAIRATETVLTRDGRVVAAAQARVPDRSGAALHIVDQGGTLLRSFGREGDSSYQDSPFAGSRALALDGQEGLWAAKRTSYQLELWSLDGSKQLELAGNASWFESWVTDAPLSPDAPPLPWVQAIRVDKQGRLWVLCRVASDDFAASLATENTPRGRQYRLIDYARAFDTMIEVIDPVAKRLLASTRVDSYLTNFLDDDTALGVREDASGVPMLDLWRVRLDTPPGWR